MGKRKLVLLVALLVFFSIVACIYKIKTNSKLTLDEKSKINSLVISYYNNMMNKNYKGTLDLIDITQSEYDKDLEILNSTEGYVFQQRLEGNNWIIPCNGSYDCIIYDQQSNCFTVNTGANIIYKNLDYYTTENVFVKRTGNNFKIIKVITNDRFAYIRGSFINR